MSMISVRICHESQSDQNLTMKGWNRSEQETLFFYCPKDLMKGEFFMMYLLLIVGFVFLIKGADLFVEGAGSLAHSLKIPSIIIGLTVIAMGTSAPETAVSISSSHREQMKSL